MSTTILVVDDSSMVRTQVKKALCDAGFSVIEAADGADALQKLSDTPETALVVCDVNMPVMSGLEFLEKVRSGSSCASVAVVMLTTEGQPDLMQQARALGAKAWIVKPFQPELLVAAAKKLTAAP